MFVAWLPRFWTAAYPASASIFLGLVTLWLVCGFPENEMPDLNNAEF